MKQAILITAYRDLEQLQSIVDFFDADFDFYIHIDRKCAEPLPTLREEGVYIERRYRISWGSEQHLWAIMHLLRKAVAQEPYTYYHLITASDFPIKSVEQFKQFFDKEGGRSYIEYHPLPRADWPEEGGLGRVQRYWVGNQWRDSREGLPALTRALLKWQRKLGIRRHIAGARVYYGGGTYFSLTHEAASTLCAVSPRRMRRETRFTHCAEEVWPHTILLNALPLERFEAESLRFCQWDQHATGPCTLTLDDLANLEQSPCFFARKLVPPTSTPLLHHLQTTLHPDKNCTLGGADFKENCTAESAN